MTMKFKSSDELIPNEQQHLLSTPIKARKHGGLVSPLLSPLQRPQSASQSGSASAMESESIESSSFRLLMNEKPPPPQRYGIYAILYWFRHLTLVNNILKICGLIVFIICFCISMGVIIPIFSLIGLAFASMIFFAMLILFFRRVCPSTMYNILIDQMNLPHAKSTKRKDVVS